MIGIIEWFNPTKRLGFIQYETSPKHWERIFLHENQLLDRRFIPSIGDKVSFEVGSYRSKPCAVNVRSASSSVGVQASDLDILAGRGGA